MKLTIEEIIMKAIHAAASEGLVFDALIVSQEDHATIRREMGHRYPEDNRHNTPYGYVEILPGVAQESKRNENRG